MTLYYEYSKLMRSIYVADLIMECKGNYCLEVLDKNVKVIKQVRALSNDLLKPRYHVTYVIMTRCGSCQGEVRMQ